MKRLAVLIGLAVAAGACGSLPVVPDFPEARFEIPRQIRVKFVDRGVAVVRLVDLEDYVRATTLSEFAPAAGDPAMVERMLEVQAIISRTYAVSHLGRHGRDGFDLCATTHCQLFDPDRVRTSRWSEAALQAVDNTAGIVLTFGDQPAQALFHADCGGHTSDASSVWGGASRPYLVSRVDDGVPVEAHSRWEYRAPFDAVVQALAGDPRTNAAGRLQGIEVVARDDAGRAERVAIRRQAPGKRIATVTELRGEELREVLARAFGARTVKSTWFEVRREQNAFTFAGRGFGHGVGLCQAGALARLRDGMTVTDIMRQYYPGAILQAAGTRASAYHRAIDLLTGPRALSSEP